MAAQGSKETVFCGKCFTVVPKGSEFCPNCGASLSSAPGAEGSDAAVYPQLAQANLLRTRKQYKEAEDMCLAILHQYPHNFSANALMGDISVEEDHLDQAVEWYELALDIDPNAEIVREKLEVVEEKRQTQVVATTAERLGLPTEKPKTALITGVSIGAIALVGILAFLAYKAAMGTGPTHKSIVDKPILVGSPTSPSAPVAADSGKDKTISTSGSQEDQELTNVLAKSTDGAYLMDARFEPAVDGISLTYLVSDGNEKQIGASLASESFGLVKDKLDKDISEVELRAIKDKKLFYSAVVKKDAYDATQAADWQSAHKDDLEALAKAILTSETYPSAKAEADEDKATKGVTTGSTTTAGDQTAPTTTGTAAPPAATGGSTSTGSQPPAPTTPPASTSTGSSSGG